MTLAVIPEQYRVGCPFCDGIITVGYNENALAILHSEPICENTTMDIGKLVKGLALAGGAIAAGTALKKALHSVEVPGLPQSEPVIVKLHPSIQPIARELLERAMSFGIPLVVTSGYRSSKEQEYLYNKGRTTPGPIVTNAKPGTSWHNHGLAFDVALLNDGKPSWPNDQVLWNRIGAIGKAIGLKWGGDFESIKDNPHFEYHPNMTIADAIAGKRPPIA